VPETTVKRLLCCGFRRTDKAMRQVYQCWWRICREINVFFQVRISHVIGFISIYDLFTDCSLCVDWRRKYSVCSNMIAVLLLMAMW
jgi:hypothetical protein